MDLTDAPEMSSASSAVMQAARERSDALDRLVWADAEAATGARASSDAGGSVDVGAGLDGDIVVLDDRTGALTAWALARVLEQPAGGGADGGAPGRVIARSRSLADARELRSMADAFGERVAARLHVAGIDGPGEGLGDTLDEGEARPVLAVGRLPKSLNALDDWTRALARHAARTDTPVALVLGGNTRHMSRSMNDVLGRGFRTVGAGRGRGKFRCLHANGAREGVEEHAGQRGGSDGTIVGLGGVFSGGRADHGGVALAAAAPAALTDLAARADGGESFRVLDLGSGNGSVALEVVTAAKGAGRSIDLLATDIDLDAVRTTRATLAAWPDVAVSWDDAASAVADGSVDLVLLNPPFHEGTRVDPSLAGPLLDAAFRVLAPGGTLLVVHNSHLRYRPLLAARAERVREVSRDRRFTVLSATAR